MREKLKKSLHIVTCVVLSITVLLSATLTVFAWSDFTQSRANVFRGTVEKTTIVLHKYEIDKDGNITTLPVKNAEFELYKLYDDGTEKKIGGTYVTDQSGKITIDKLSSGNYKFVETNPGYGYGYPTDKDGKPIKEYYFSITAEDALGHGIKEINAYNVRKNSGLEVSKSVQGIGADLDKEFEFTIKFSDGKSYSYRLNGKGKQIDLKDGKFYLKHGETAVFDDLPAGVFYEVTETPDAEYITKSKGNQGTIQLDSMSKAEFINTYIEEPPEEKPIIITVEKIVKGEIPVSEKDREFWFTFTKNDEEPIRFSLKAGEKKTFTVKVGDTYSITEDDPFQFNYIQTSSVNGSGTAIGQEIKVTFINTYIGTVWQTIHGKKTWKLNGASESVIPESITIKLKNGDVIVETKTVYPDENGNWTYEFIAPKYDINGKEIKYTIEEVPIPGFDTTVEGNNIINTYINKTNITVTKIWTGENKNQPKNISVQLYKNGKAHGKPVTIDKSNNWMYTWKDLDANATWTVDELNVPDGYVKKITGNAQTGFIINNIYEEETPPPKEDEEVKVSGTKTWDHGSNPVKDHPTSIVVYVKNGETVVVSALITADDHWSWDFRLPKFDKNGKEIIYTIDESIVSGYTKTIDGYDIKNTYKEPGDDNKDPNIDDESIIISGYKSWNFGNAPENDRPKSITVHVLLNNKIIAQKTVTAADNWKYSFELPKYEADGVTPMRYQIGEGNIPHYTHQVDGYDLINTYKGVDYPGDNPSTGNDFNIILWSSIFIASTTVLIIILRSGHKKRKNNKQGKNNN